MKRLRLSLGWLVVLVLAAPAFAQQVKGDVELQLSGNASFTTAKESTSGNGAVFFNVGYYVTRMLQIRGGLGASIHTLDACSLADFSGTKPVCLERGDQQLVADPTFNIGATFNFSGEGQKTVPYIGADYAEIGVHKVGALEQDGSGFSEPYPLKWTSNVRVNGGIKYFARRNIAFDFNVGWNKDLKDTSSDVNVFDIRFGFSYVF